MSQATPDRLFQSNLWRRHLYPRVSGVLEVVDGVCLILFGSQRWIGLALRFAFWDALRNVRAEREKAGRR